jgi:hypothetical protein
LIEEVDSAVSQRPIATREAFGRRG